MDSDCSVYYNLETYLMGVVHSRFQRDGRLSAFDFFCIVIWKANRAKSKISRKLLSHTHRPCSRSARWLASGIPLRATYLCIAAMLGGCSSGPPRELTTSAPYAALVGTEYRVVSNDLWAYGVYGDWPERRVTYMTLIPGVGIAGYEIAFSKRVPTGTIIQIESAWWRPVLLESGVYYLVTINDADLSNDVPVRIELFRGNEGEGPNLNPSVYMRLSESSGR